MKYEDAVRRIWRHADTLPSNKAEAMRELVRYATFAASSHNTQCWLFRIAEDTIEILPDLSRRCPIVDPDDHHLYVSLGCAVETLITAAVKLGYSAEPELCNEQSGSIKIYLTKAEPKETALFDAILDRQCTRSVYDGSKVSAEQLNQLEQAGITDNTRIELITDKTKMETVLEYVVEANTCQLRDSDFVAELKQWIRFSDGEAIKKGDGLSGKSSGSPSAPRWLISPFFRLFLNAKTLNDAYAKQIRSSAGIAVFSSKSDSKADWVEVGRSYTRFALLATTMGIRNSFVNQPVEVREVKGQFASAVGLDDKSPDLVVRFGRSARMPNSLRRPVESVIISKEGQIRT